MNVNGTPLEREPTGQVHLNDQPLQVYQEPFDLPCDEARRAACERHLEMGVADELYNQFWMAGCNFDTARKEGVVCVQFSCIGQSVLDQFCHMTLTQYDTQGRVLNTRKIREKLD